MDPSVHLHSCPVNVVESCSHLAKSEHWAEHSKDGSHHLDNRGQGNFMTCTSPKTLEMLGDPWVGSSQLFLKKKKKIPPISRLRPTNHSAELLDLHHWKKKEVTLNFQLCSIPAFSYTCGHVRDALGRGRWQLQAYPSSPALSGLLHQGFCFIDYCGDKNMPPYSLTLLPSKDGLIRSPYHGCGRRDFLLTNRIRWEW